MNFTESLESYYNTHNTWRETPFHSLMQSAELMKDMSIVLADLTKHKVEYQKKWNGRCFLLIKNEGMTGTAAEKITNKEIPEVDQLRQILKAGYYELDTMRSQVSLLKSER